MSQTYQFDRFELDLDAQQLRSNGEPVHLERRPLDLLILLASRRGSLVRREEIIAALWPPNVIIDFDSGLNTLVRKIRNALGDSPDEPRFVETVPGRGYRFIATITEPATVDPTTIESATVEPASRDAVAPGRRRMLLLVAVFLVAVIMVGFGFTWRSEVGEPVQTRIVVMPFENLTGDDDLAYLAAGIAEETNAALGQIDLPNLSVIGVASSRALAESHASLQDIGHQLGVDFIVLSSLRLDESRIRVTSRLLRVSDGAQVWSASFDRALTNLLGLQRELSIAIAEQIRQRLSPSVAAEIDQRQTQNPAAYELYLRGRNEWTQFQPDSIPRALAYYEQAVAIDPGYALAWAGIAHALVTSVATVEAERETARSASLDALQRALEYGPDLAETQLALASYYGFLDDDMAAAEAAARRAVELGPNNAMAHMYLGLVLTQTDKYVQARDMLRRARQLDPLFPLMFANSAVAALMAGEPAEALEFATQAVAIDPQFWVGHLHLGTALFELGDLEGAVRAYSDAEKLSGNNSARAASGRAFALTRLGRNDEARDVLAELLSRSEVRHVPPHYIAFIYAGLGEADSAFEWLDRSMANSDTFCLGLASNKKLESLRADRRFDTLLNRCPTAGSKK